jgi:DNA (cytosine-5)-methyltransferase 1
MDAEKPSPAASWRRSSSHGLTVGSLFSGIGGFDLGLERSGMRTVWVVENDPFCQFVLSKRFPNAERHSDVRHVSREVLEPVDVLCGGFPCQDISIVGNAYNGAGIDGSQSGLWSEFARLIRELRPRYVAIENAQTLTVKGLDRVLSALASCGYDAEWSVLSAAAFGAPHIRERLIVLAYPHRNGLEGGLCNDGRVFTSAERWEGWRNGIVRSTWWDTEPEPQRVDDGISGRSHASWKHRTKALGNALIPQIAEYIGWCIMCDYEAQYEHQSPTAITNVPLR